MPDFALVLDAVSNWHNVVFAAVMATACIFVFGARHPT